MCFKMYQGGEGFTLKFSCRLRANAKRFSPVVSCSMAETTGGDLYLHVTILLFNPYQKRLLIPNTHTLYTLQSSIILPLKATYTWFSNPIFNKQNYSSGQIFNYSPMWKIVKLLNPVTVWPFFQPKARKRCKITCNKKDAWLQVRPGPPETTNIIYIGEHENSTFWCYCFIQKFCH